MVNKITVEGVTYTVTSTIENLRTGKIEPYDREKHLDLLTKQYLKTMPLDLIANKDSEPKKNANPKFICYVNEDGRVIECETVN